MMVAEEKMIVDGTAMRTVQSVCSIVAECSTGERAGRWPGSMVRTLALGFDLRTVWQRNMTEISIPWRAPLDWEHLEGFLGRRAIPGVESFDGGEYVRGAVRVRSDGRKRRLVVTTDGHDRVAAEERVRRLFDVDTDSRAVADHLRRDRLLRPLVERHPGIRVPGGWEPFEIAIRAIAGQQVTVAAARTIVGAIAAECGERTTHGLAFPTADRVANADLRLGMPRRRLECIRSLAKDVASGAVRLQRGSTLEETISSLEKLPGVGPWTANYIAMRGLGEPDAFPAGDLILRRAAGNLTEQQLLRKAERWRPWRAYAAILLWTK